VLEEIRGAIAANLDLLDMPGWDAITSGPRLTFEPDINTWVWEVEQAEFRRLIDDAAFRASVATHFAQMSRLERLLSLLNSYSTGVNSAVGSSAHIAPALRTSIATVLTVARSSGETARQRIVQSDDGRWRLTATQTATQPPETGWIRRHLLSWGPRRDRSQAA
jgi:hypothetical protein